MNSRILSDMSRPPLSFWRLHGAWGIYLNELFRRISTNMVSLFIPLHILKETGSLPMIPLYYLVYACTALISDYPGALAIKRLGIDKSLAIGSVLRAVFLYSLIFARYNHTMFLVSALFFGLTQPFDWLPYHYTIAKLSQSTGSYGSAASMSRTVTRIGATLGPILGGICIQLFGFTTLYLIAGTLITAAAVIPFFDTFEKVGMHVSGSEILQRLRDPGMGKHIIAIGLENAENLVSTIVWPLVLFANLGNYEKTGSLETASLLIGIAGLYLASLWVKKKKFGPVMLLGALCIILGWAGRLVASGSTSLWVANTGYFIGISWVWIPLWTLLYAQSVTQKYTMEFWLVHEIIGHIWLSLTALVVLVLFLAGISLKLVILGTIGLSAIGLLFPLIYKEHIRKYG